MVEAAGDRNCAPAESFKIGTLYVIIAESRALTGWHYRGDNYACVWGGGRREIDR